MPFQLDDSLYPLSSSYPLIIPSARRPFCRNCLIFDTYVHVSSYLAKNNATSRRRVGNVLARLAALSMIRDNCHSENNTVCWKAMSSEGSMIESHDHHTRVLNHIQRGNGSRSVARQICREFTLNGTGSFLRYQGSPVTGRRCLIDGYVFSNKSTKASALGRSAGFPQHCCTTIHSLLPILPTSAGNLPGLSGRFGRVSPSGMTGFSSV